MELDPELKRKLQHLLAKGIIDQDAYNELLKAFTPSIPEFSDESSVPPVKIPEQSKNSARFIIAGAILLAAIGITLWFSTRPTPPLPIYTLPSNIESVTMGTTSSAYDMEEKRGKWAVVLKPNGRVSRYTAISDGKDYVPIVYTDMEGSIVLWDYQILLIYGFSKAPYSDYFDDNGSLIPGKEEALGKILQEANKECKRIISDLDQWFNSCKLLEYTIT